MMEERNEKIEERILWVLPDFVDLMVVGNRCWWLGWRRVLIFLWAG